MGRGGRILLDRSSSNYDEVWSRLDYKIFDTTTSNTESPLPGIIDNKLLDNSVEKGTEESSDRLLGQTSIIQNNHHLNNIVIKSENSKNQESSDDQMDRISHGEKSCSVNNQKLDDFEQLLDSASASSNIINKKLVCRNNSDISDESFILMSTTEKSSLSNNDLTKNLNVGLISSSTCEASNSRVSSTNDSLNVNQNNTISQLDVVDTTSHEQVTEDDEEDNEFLKPESATGDFYLNFFDEIKNDWLHFRPKTPPISPSPTDDVLFSSDLIDSTKKFAVELQMLDERFNETEMGSCTDNIYLSQPMSFNLCQKYIQLNDVEMQEPTISVKTEPTDFDFTEEVNSSVESSSAKINEDDAVKRLLEKYQNDIANDESLGLNVDDINFDECISYNHAVGCSNFKLLNDDLKKAFNWSNSIDTLKHVKGNDGVGVTIKMETSDVSLSSVQNMTIPKEAPIAELQSHNYVLQYGSPVSSNTVSLNSIPSNSNLLSCGPNINVGPMDSGIVPATTLFQQQFINSGNTIISTQQQSQQNKLQPLVYDSNTIVLASARKQMNGPSDRNCKYKLDLFLFFSLLIFYLFQ